MGFTRPKRRDLKSLVLREGPHDGVELDIAPTMENIVYKGERYYRMAGAFHVKKDDSMGGCYLWAEWCPLDVHEHCSHHA